MARYCKACAVNWSPLIPFLPTTTAAVYRSRKKQARSSKDENSADKQWVLLLLYTAALLCYIVLLLYLGLLLQPLSTITTRRLQAAVAAAICKGPTNVFQALVFDLVSGGVGCEGPVRLHSSDDFVEREIIFCGVPSATFRLVQ